MSKLHIFAITNICTPIFVTFGRIGELFGMHFTTVERNATKKCKKVVYNACASLNFRVTR
jgi:hypothetical protein